MLFIVKTGQNVSFCAGKTMAKVKSLFTVSLCVKPLLQSDFKLFSNRLWAHCFPLRDQSWKTTSRTYTWHYLNLLELESSAGHSKWSQSEFWWSLDNLTGLLSIDSCISEKVVRFGVKMENLRCEMGRRYRSITIPQLQIYNELTSLEMSEVVAVR